MEGGGGGEKAARRGAAPAESEAPAPAAVSALYNDDDNDDIPNNVNNVRGLITCPVCNRYQLATHTLGLNKHCGEVYRSASKCLTKMLPASQG